MPQRRTRGGKKWEREQEAWKTRWNRGRRLNRKEKRGVLGMACRVEKSRGNRLGKFERE